MDESNSSGGLRALREKHTALEALLASLGEEQDACKLVSSIQSIVDCLTDVQAHQAFWSLDGPNVVVKTLEANMHTQVLISGLKCVGLAPSTFGGYGERLASVLTKCLQLGSSAALVNEACNLLQTLLAEGTLRLERFAPHMQSIVANLIDHTSTCPTSSVLKALHSLADKAPESRQVFGDFGGMSKLVDIIDGPTNSQNTNLKSNALLALQSQMHSYSINKTLFGQVGGMSICLDLANNRDLASQACRVLATATCDHYLNKTTTSALDSLVKVLNVAQNPSVVQHACRAIYNLASENQPCVSAFLQVAKLVRSFVQHKRIVQFIVDDPSSDEPSMVETSMVEPSVVETSMVETSMVETSMVETSMVETSMVEPSVVKPSVVETSMVEPSVVKPSVVETICQGLGTDEDQQSDASPGTPETPGTPDAQYASCFVQDVPPELVVEACMALSRLAYNTRLHDPQVEDALFVVLRDAENPSVLDGACCCLTALLRCRKHSSPNDTDNIQLVVSIVKQAQQPRLASQACHLLAQMVLRANYNPNHTSIHEAVFCAMSKHFEHFEFDHTNLPRTWVDTFILDHYAPTY